MLARCPCKFLALQRTAGNRATRRALQVALEDRGGPSARTRFLARQQAPQAAEPAVEPVTIRWTGSVQSSLFDFLRALRLSDERAATVARAVIAQARTSSRRAAR